MQAASLLQDLALVLVVAALVTIGFRLLHQPPVLGYLLAGMIVGEHVPIPVVVQTEQVEALSELGVILVMFAIGLHVSVRSLLRLLPTAGLTCAIQMTGMMWLGYLVGLALGWSSVEALFAGAMVAISST